MPTKAVARDTFTVNDFEAIQTQGFWHRYGGLVAVVALHAALLWLVFNGLTHQVPKPNKVVTQTLIQEVAIPRAPALSPPIPVPMPTPVQVEPDPPAPQQPAPAPVPVPEPVEPEPLVLQPPAPVTVPVEPDPPVLPPPEPIPPPSPEPVLVESEPPTPTPVEPEKPVVKPAPVVAPQAPKPVVVQRAAPATNATAPAAKPSAPPAPASVPTQNQVTPPNTQSLESEYVRQVQAMLNATKRYPTGRQASLERPVGKVRIVFVLNRSGVLVNAMVQVSSNINMLDDAALSAVRRATYPAFTGDLWKGQDTHEFSVDIDFVPPGNR